MNRDCGLTSEDISAITNVVSRFVEIDQAVLFGSRAKGNYKAGSDVDISIEGEKITHRTVIRLSAFLNEVTRMPYHFDIVQFNAIKNEELKEHIRRVGIILYERTSQKTKEDA